MNIRRPRLSIDITEEQDRELCSLIPWGMKTGLFSMIVDDLIRILKDSKTRSSVILSIIERRRKLEDYITIGGVEENDSERSEEESS